MSCIHILQATGCHAQTKLFLPNPTVIQLYNSFTISYSCMMQWLDRISWYSDKRVIFKNVHGFLGSVLYLSVSGGRWIREPTTAQNMWPPLKWKRDICNPPSCGVFNICEPPPTCIEYKADWELAWINSRGGVGGSAPPGKKLKFGAKLLRKNYIM